MSLLAVLAVRQRLRRPTVIGMDPAKWPDMTAVYVLKQAEIAEMDIGLQMERVRREYEMHVANTRFRESMDAMKLMEASKRVPSIMPQGSALQVIRGTPGIEEYVRMLESKPGR